MITIQMCAQSSLRASLSHYVINPELPALLDINLRERGEEQNEENFVRDLLGVQMKIN